MKYYAMRGLVSALTLFSVTVWADNASVDYICQFSFPGGSKTAEFVAANTEALLAFGKTGPGNSIQFETRTLNGLKWLGGPNKTVLQASVRDYNKNRFANARYNLGDEVHLQLMIGDQSAVLAQLDCSPK